jgi:chaperone required for assembly of F1-ATPase
MKRFYKTVATRPHQGGWQVMLDERAMKTVKGAPQLLPTRDLATALAAEWDVAGDRLDPRGFPLRDMADYAIDIVAPKPETVIAKLATYGDTDTLLYRADPDEPLYARQQEVWEPITSAFEEQHGITLKRVSGVMHASQDEAAMTKLREAMGALDPFALAALETMTSLAASLTIGLSALEPEAEIDALWQAASLEEEWQAELWGRDEEAEQRRVRRAGDFTRAARFARLARG